MHEGHPVVVPGYCAFGYSTAVITRELQHERDKLEQLQPTRAGVPCMRQLLVGDPTQEVLRFAEQQGIDLIVMGTHGRTGVRRALMGSVAEAVVRGARRPVLTVKHPIGKGDDGETNETPAREINPQMRELTNGLA